MWALVRAWMGTPDEHRSKSVLSVRPSGVLFHLPIQSERTMTMATRIVVHPNGDISQETYETEWRKNLDAEAKEQAAISARVLKEWRDHQHDSERIGTYL